MPSARRRPSGERAIPPFAAGMNVQSGSTAVACPSRVTHTTSAGDPAPTPSPGTNSNVPSRDSSMSTAPKEERTPSSTGTGADSNCSVPRSNGTAKMPPSERPKTTRPSPTYHALTTSSMSWCQAPVSRSRASRAELGQPPVQITTSAPRPSGRPATDTTPMLSVSVHVQNR